MHVSPDLPADTRGFQTCQPFPWYPESPQPRAASHCHLSAFASLHRRSRGPRWRFSCFAPVDGSLRYARYPGLSPSDRPHCVNSSHASPSRRITRNLCNFTQEVSQSTLCGPPRRQATHLVLDTTRQPNTTCRAWLGNSQRPSFLHCHHLNRCRKSRPITKMIRPPHRQCPVLALSYHRTP
jgi:hypothetical protein